MEIRKKVSGNDWEVFLSGQLTYNDRMAFNDVVFAFSKGGADSLIVDFSDITFVDSNGIGMLLVLHDDASKNGKKVTIRGLNGHVQRVFENSQLGNLFDVK